MVASYERSFKAKPLSTNPNQVSYSGVYIGFVKDNTDIQRMGRLRVYIPLLGGDSNNPEYWHTVSYCSPFAGASPADQNVVNGKTMASSQTSYGFWMIPPDRENEVIVMFINGDPSSGIWLGCLYQQNMNHMIPGVASDVSFQNDNVCVPFPPVVEYNKKDKTLGDVQNPTRPRFDPLNTAFANQGLQGDPQRGPTNASARRDAPSQVFGYISPRSHNIYIDDGLIDTTANPNPSTSNPAYSYTQDPNANEYIRLRTRNGVQVLINDTTGFVYINSRSGNSWVEISDQGVDVFSQERVSIRAMKDINLHADQNINMYAGGDIRMYSVGNIRMQSNQDMSIKSGATIDFTSSNDMNLFSGGGLNLQASDTVNINGSTVITSELFAPNVHVDNCFANISFGAVPGPNGSPQSPGNAQSAPDIPTNSFIDRTLSPPCYPPVNNTTITTRTPTHEPWVQHPSGQASTNGADSGVNFAVNKAGYPPITIQPAINNITDGKILDGPGQNSTTSKTPTQNIVTGDGLTRTVQTPFTGAMDTSCSPPAIRDDVKQAILTASDQTGSDPGLMFAIANTESGFNPNAQSTTSSASGLYQFTNGTWSSMVNRYGSQTQITTADITDPQSNATMGGLFTQQNTQFLQANGIPNPNPTQLYISHFLGAQGAANFLNADPNSSAADAVGPAAANANRSIFYNSDGSPKTVQQVYNNFDSKISPQVSKFNQCFTSNGSSSGTNSG